MIPIKKGKAPKKLVDDVASLRSNPNMSANYGNLSHDAKDAARKALVAEQGGLCAYCMRRIGKQEHHATIEHIVPQHDANGVAHDRESIDYGNMLAVCDGGAPEPGQHVRKDDLTCDKHRGNAPLTVNPLVPRTLEKIRYSRNGEIHSDDPVIDDDLTRVLNLNAKGRSLCDNRREVMNQLERKISEQIKSQKIERDNRAKKRLCERMLRELTAQNRNKDEYLGVKIFRLEKLIRKFS